MSNVALSGNALGTGTFTIASPNSSTDRTLTLPDATTTIVGTDATQTLTNKTLGSGLVAGASLITSGTAQASTSGTNIDFTGIPSWVKRITVMFNGVSTNGTSNYQVQIGSGSVTATGYVSGASLGTTFVSSTTGLIFTASFSVANAANGSMILSLLNSNTWTAMAVIGVTGATGSQMGGGVSPALGGTLDRVRITTVNGTDTFDAGTINILYE
jgi:hypothetical protein